MKIIGAIVSAFLLIVVLASMYSYNTTPGQHGLGIKGRVPYVPPIAPSDTIVLYYYPTWGYGSWSVGSPKFPPESLYVDSKTYVVLFDAYNVDSTAPHCGYMLDSTTAKYGSQTQLFYAAYSNPGGWPGSPTLWFDRTLTAVHAGGGKLLLSIVAINSPDHEYVAADSARTEVYAKSVCEFAHRFDFDGLELDWERFGPGRVMPSQDIVGRYLRILRRNMDAVWGGTTTPLIVSAFNSYYDKYPLYADAYVTAYIMQMYNYDTPWGGWAGETDTWGCNVVWHLSPLYRGSVPAANQGSETAGWDTRGPVQWMNVGHEATKLGVIIPAYGARFKTEDSIHHCYGSWSNLTEMYPYIKAKALADSAGTLYHDAERGYVPYISGTTTGALTTYGLAAREKFFMTYEDSTSYYWKMHWLDSLGITKVGFYDAVSSLDYTKRTKAKRFPHFNWIKQGLGY